MHLYLVPNVFITLKGDLYPFNSWFQLLFPPSHWQSLIHFLSLGIYIFLVISYKYSFWIFHINGITQDETSCIWLLSLSIMFSRFIQVVAGISTSFFFFLTEYYCVVCVYHNLFILLLDIWLVSTFWLLGIVPLWTCIYVHLFESAWFFAEDRINFSCTQQIFAEWD